MPLGPPRIFQVSPNVVSRARSVAVADGSGGQIVVFEEDYRGNVDPYAQKLNSSGRDSGAAWRHLHHTGSQDSPRSL
jgi:hypothetical protein